MAWRASASRALGEGQDVFEKRLGLAEGPRGGGGAYRCESSWELSPPLPAPAPPLCWRSWARRALRICGRSARGFTRVGARRELHLFKIGVRHCNLRAVLAVPGGGWRGSRLR